MRIVAIVAVVACAAAVAACPAGPTQVGVQPSWRAQATPARDPVRPVVFAPQGAAAARYNEPPTGPAPSALGDEAVGAVFEAAKAAGLPLPTPDARLFRACEELAQVVPEEGVVSYGLVEFALQRNGIIEPSPHLLVVWGDIDSPKLIVDQIRPRLAEILHDGATARVGIGMARRSAKDANGAVVFALQGSSLSTAPIARTAPRGGSFPIDAVVNESFQNPEVFVTHDDGATERLPLALGHRGAFTAQVGCDAHVGRQQVEITASDASGSTVLANFPVWCGAEPPVEMTIAPTDDGAVADASDAERRLLALVNRDRQAANLPPLAWDEQVAGVARGHSEEMRRTKVVAHISPTTGSAADRVHAAGIKTAVVLENVARAYGVGEAHDGLMNSPGHRANIMSTQATTIGIGVVLGDDVSGRREMFVTQVFTRKPPRIDPGRAADDVRARLASARPQIANEARLTSIAQQLADALAAGKTREEAWPAVKARVDALGGGYARIGSVITAVSDLATVDGKNLLGAGAVDEVGVGIAQGPHPDIGDNAIWIVVIMAERVKK